MQPLRYIFTATACVLALLPAGCAKTYLGYGPHFSAVDNAIERIAVLAPDIRAYEVSGGGIPEYRVDWSDTGGRACMQAAAEELKVHMFEPVTVEKDTSKSVLDSLTAFVELVIRSIQGTLYVEQPFLNQLDSFTYSIGPIHDLCSRYNTDAVMFLFGIDERYSDLRKKTLETEATVKTARSGCFATLSMIFLGVGTFVTYSAMPERTWLCCCVAEREGRIIWFKQHLQADNADLTKRGSAKGVVKKVLDGLLRRKPKQS